MNLFRKVSLFFIILAFISKIVLASNYNFESNANGIFEIQSIMLISLSKTKNFSSGLILLIKRNKFFYGTALNQTKLGITRVHLRYL